MSAPCPQRRSSVLPAAATLVLVVGTLAGCAKEETARRGGRVPIDVASVEQRSIPYELEATGTVEASQSAAITARVGGAVSRIAFRDGDLRSAAVVARGQALVERPVISTAELDQKRAAAEAQGRTPPQLMAVVPEAEDRLTGTFGRAAGAGLES